MAKPKKTHIPECPMTDPEGKTVYMTRCSRVVEPEQTDERLRLIDCEACLNLTDSIGQRRVTLR